MKSKGRTARTMAARIDTGSNTSSYDRWEKTKEFLDIISKT